MAKLTFDRQITVCRIDKNVCCPGYAPIYTRMAKMDTTQVSPIRSIMNASIARSLQVGIFREVGGPVFFRGCAETFCKFLIKMRAVDEATAIDYLLYGEGGCEKQPSRM